MSMDDLMWEVGKFGIVVWAVVWAFAAITSARGPKFKSWCHRITAKLKEAVER